MLEKYEEMLRGMKEYCNNHSCENCEMKRLCDTIMSGIPCDFEFEEDDEEDEEDEETYEDYLYEEFRESKI